MLPSPIPFSLSRFRPSIYLSIYLSLVPFNCLRVCGMLARINIFTVLPLLVCIPLISYSKCIWYGKRMHETAHVPHTNYSILWIYGENVQNNIFAVKMNVMHVVESISHKHTHAFPYHGIAHHIIIIIPYFSVWWSSIAHIPSHVCILQTSTISLCASHIRWISLKPHRSYVMLMMILDFNSSPFKYYKFFVTNGHDCSHSTRCHWLMVENLNIWRRKFSKTGAQYFHWIYSSIFVNFDCITHHHLKKNENI